jgi:hypothetical protein
MDPNLIGAWTIVNGEYALTRIFRGDGTVVARAAGFDDDPTPFRISDNHIIFLVEQPDGSIYEQKERYELVGDTLKFLDDDGSVRIFVRDPSQELQSEEAHPKSRNNLDELTRWSFSFRSDEIEPLMELGEFLDGRLREFFHVLIQESVEEYDADGSVNEGAPMLRLEFVGSVDEPMLAGMNERLESLAVRFGVRYEGGTSYPEFPFDLDMFDAAIAAEFPEDIGDDED